MSARALMRVMTVVGVRPELIKAAPVSDAMSGLVEEFFVHTGQHYDQGLSADFFAELSLPEPDVHLGVGSGTHGQQTAAILIQLDELMRVEQPDRVIVYGDTNSTLGGALAAAKLGISISHVEAGLRSGRRDMAEETNRVLVDRLSDQLFCPTQSAIDNLAAEGIYAGVTLVGDVNADALDRALPHLSMERVTALGVARPYVFATIHRAENLDDTLRLTNAIALLGAMPLQVVFPMHPGTRKAINNASIAMPSNVLTVPPLGFIDTLSVVRYAAAVLTDSGGLQKESAALGTRCITLRPETEWSETVESGWNTVVDLDIGEALRALRSALPTTIMPGFEPGASTLIAHAIAGVAR